MIDYWIQRADFSVSEHTASSAEEIVEVLRTHDWAEEIAFCREVELDGRDSCPPGLGITFPGGRFLHFCFPNEETGVAEVFSEGTREGTNTLVPEEEWERTLNAFLERERLPGKKSRRRSELGGLGARAPQRGGIPLWTWIMAAFGLVYSIAVPLYSIGGGISGINRDIVIIIGFVSVVPWAFYSATDTASSGLERFRGWLTLALFVFVVMTILSARLGRLNP